MSVDPQRPKRRRGVSGLAVPAGVLIGIGIGLLTDSVAAGTLIGLGAGLLAMMVARLVLGDW